MDPKTLGTGLDKRKYSKKNKQKKKGIATFKASHLNHVDLQSRNSSWACINNFITKPFSLICSGLLLLYSATEKKRKKLLKFGAKPGVWHLEFDYAEF